MIILSEVDQVVQEHFVKQNVPNSSFHLVVYKNYTIKIYILSRSILVATTLTKVILFEVGLPGIL